MKTTIKRTIIFAAMIQVMGSHAWAATVTLPSTISLPTRPASASSASTSGSEPLEKLNLPNEIPIEMKQFPPLQSMHFDMVPTFQDIPVSNYVEGTTRP